MPLHRRRPVRAGPGLSQPAAERGAGDAARRHHRCQPPRRPAAPHRSDGHGMRHRTRSSAPDLRRLHDHQTPRAGARPRDLAAHRGQLGGAIRVGARCGRGTTFTLDVSALSAGRIPTQVDDAGTRSGTGCWSRPGDWFDSGWSDWRAGRSGDCADWGGPSRAPRGRSPARESTTRQDRVLHLLRDARLDDGLGGNLDRLTGGRVAAHAGLRLPHVELHHAGQRELARALQLLL